MVARVLPAIADHASDQLIAALCMRAVVELRRTVSGLTNFITVYHEGFLLTSRCPPLASSRLSDNDTKPRHVNLLGQIMLLIALY